MGTEILWQILGVSFLCSISTFIYPDREMSKKASTILMVVHYLIINAIVLGCGLKFVWFYAQILNERLKEYQEEKKDL